MKPTLEDLQNFINVHEVVFASESRPNKKKKLIITMRGSFAIYKGEEKYWEGMQPFVAIEKYNDL